MRSYIRNSVVAIGVIAACIYVLIARNDRVILQQICQPTNQQDEVNCDNLENNMPYRVPSSDVDANPNAVNGDMVDETEDMFEVDKAEPEEVLVEGYVPNTLYYIFCQQNELWFNQYMALLSAIRHIRPDNILFYYDLTEPGYNAPFYNRFYMDLKDEFPVLRSIQVDTSKACNSAKQPKMEFVYELLFPDGGWYIHETTMITHYHTKLSNYSLIDGLDKNTGHGFMAAKQGLPLDMQTMNITALKTNPHLMIMTVSCSDNSTYSMAREYEKPLCINIPNRFYPKDIMELDNDFGKITRLVFYKKSSLAVARQSSDELIPNIGHLIWLGGGNMDYLFYLGALSLLYVAEVDRLYFHGDRPPTGENWEKLKQNPRVTYVYRKLPETVYGTPVKVPAHVSDIIRVDLMIKYGGIYIDADAMFVQKLTMEQRTYDAIVTYDWPEWHKPFPDTINNGVLAGKRNAEFWHLFQDSFREYRDNNWFYNGLLRSYQLWERHPDLVKIDPHLQVICFKLKCHPTWIPGYHNGSQDHTNTAVMQDYKKEAFVIHWTDPNPEEMKDEETLKKNNNTFFGQMGYYVLQKAGIV